MRDDQSHSSTVRPSEGGASTARGQRSHCGDGCTSGQGGTEYKHLRVIECAAEHQPRGRERQREERDLFKPSSNLKKLPHTSLTGKLRKLRLPFSLQLIAIDAVPALSEEGRRSAVSWIVRGGTR